jgi:LemA protein
MKSLLKSWIFWVIVVLGVLFAISYNGLVSKDEAANNAWGQVENVYQRRADLIPNLMETVKGYMAHERGTLEAVTQARQQVVNVMAEVKDKGINLAASPEMQKQFFQAQDGLNSALSRLMVVVEKYPDLKANESVAKFMDEQAGTENRVAVERKRFQDSVNAYNVSVRGFPSLIVAKICGFDKREYYKADEGASKAPKVKF